MNFSLTEEQAMIQKVVRDFAEKELAPIAAELDEKGEFPHAITAKMGEMGLFGLPFSEEYGGSGAGYLAYAIAVEEISRACASTGITYAAHCSIGTGPIYLFGTEEQKKKWVVPCAQGKMFAAFGLTEPNAGSDAGGTQTTAVLDGDEWVLNGSKCFITNVGVGKVAVITALTDKSKGTRGISSFIVPTDTPGFTVGTKYHKLGLLASDTREIILENVRIPKENILGKPGEGFKQFLVALDGGRISIGALSVGIAQACLDASLKYAKEREQFGQPISKFQAIQFKLADMAMKTELARMMVHKAAWLKDQGKPFSKEAAYAKLYASEICMQNASEAIQIHGGYGYMKEYPVERYFRDAKLMEIGEGTSEVQRLVIARLLGC
ncbi:MAG: acyl-CoA dehydrogenase [Clostridiales bacterium]|jgi:alkylation response protein AidB-like acyl-CoA dehydrogenase|nr:acyl-CoA dehydrogenase [Clostridiales bacterium]